jgi:predicted SAM-dependent methyltransferase
MWSSVVSREPTWRGENETDWGLASLQHWEELAGALRLLWRLMAREARLVAGASRLQRLARESRRELLLSLGSGRDVPPGWIGIDLFRRGPNVLSADLRRPLPLPGGSVAAILAEHVLEHLPLDDLPRLVSECHRVLRPGGVLRVVSPDARLLARLVNGEPRLDMLIRRDHDVHRWRMDPLSRWRVVNRLSHQWGQHQSLLSAEPCVQLMMAAGFTGVRECRPAETVYFGSRPGTHFARFPGAEDEAFAVEGRRP